MVQLLAEYNQLQAQAAQLLQTRIAQLQAETARLSAMYQAQMAQQAQVNQMLQPEAGQQQQPAPDAAQRQPAEGTPEQVAEGNPEQATENLHHVGKHPIIQTEQPEAASTILTRPRTGSTWPPGKLPCSRCRRRPASRKVWTKELKRRNPQPASSRRTVGPS